MNEKRYSTRQHRRLPRLPARRASRDQWMNFRESENWLQRHQEILDRSLSLLEIHPRLLHDKSCARLLDFITKISLQNFFEDISRTKGSSIATIEENKLPEELHVPIPVISVSTVEAKHDTCKSEINKVHICGDSNDTRWHRLIVGLAERFLVKYCRTDTIENGADTNDYQDLENADTLLFIIDTFTTTDPACLKLLKTALNRDMPVSYVRHEDYVLPKDMSPEVLDLDDGDKYMNNNTIHAMDELISKSSQACSSKPNSTQSPDDIEDTKRLRPDSGISLSYGRSAGDISGDISKSHDPDMHVSSLPTDIVSDVAEKPLTNVPAFEKSECDGDEVVAFLQHVHNKALTYSMNNHKNSLTNIVMDIESHSAHQMFATKEHELTADVYISEANSTKDGGNTKPLHDTNPDDTIQAIKNNSWSRRESVDTVFFVYPSELSNSTQPQIVRYPKDLEVFKVPPSPSMESFGFQDIDLSKAINELNLFMSDEEDDLKDCVTPEPST